MSGAMNAALRNTTIGCSSGQAITTGDDNVMVGHDTGNSITTGSNNTYVGRNTDGSAVGVTNETALGYAVTPPGGGNSVTLGNADVTEVYCSQDKGATLYAAGVVVTGGINFPDDASANPSADVNTLDNYEEGVYEPTVSDTGEGGTPTIAGTSNDLSYTKIGRFVNIVGTIQVTAVTSCTGTLAITLPFTAKANASGTGYHGVSIVTYTVNINGSLGVILQPSPGEAIATFYAEVDNSTAANQMATGYYRVNFQYEA